MFRLGFVLRTNMCNNGVLKKILALNEDKVKEKSTKTIMM
jgi:hypothetical protein